MPKLKYFSIDIQYITSQFIALHYLLYLHYIYNNDYIDSIALTYYSKRKIFNLLHIIN